MSQTYLWRWIDGAGKLHEKSHPWDDDEAEIFRHGLSQQLNPAMKAMAFLPDRAVKTSKKLCVMDMDSTLINQEVIDEMARLFGFYDEVAAITEQAMQGKLDFTQALKQRWKLFENVPHERFTEILPRLTLSPGAEKFLPSIQIQGVKTAIVSGGFLFVLEHFQKQLKINQVHGHTLNLDPPIIDALQKRTIVTQMKKEYSATLDETIVIGDGANDIEMMREATIRVSFCGKPKLNEAVNTWVTDRNLAWLIPLLSP